MLRYIGKFFCLTVLIIFAGYGIFLSALNFAAPVSREYSQRYSFVRMAELRASAARKAICQNLSKRDDLNLILRDEKKLKFCIEKISRDLGFNDLGVFAKVLDGKLLVFAAYIPPEVSLNQNDRFFVADCFELSCLLASAESFDGEN